MKITKKLHEEISSFLDSYWSAYFAGDLEMWSSFIPDDYRNIGTTNEEIWSSKKDILDYTNSVLDQMVGQADFQNKKIEIISYEPYLMVHELGDLYVKNEGEWVFYAPFRLSSILSQIDDGWQVLHQHGSYPDSRTVEGEAFAVNALKAENKKLLAAVAKRTKELEEKNTALEIEAALERVRSMAMGMQKQQDLLKVCKQVYRELQSLGFSNGELRNAQIVINNDDKRVYYGYQHSAQQGSEFAEVPYTIHPTVTYLRDQLKKSDEAFVDIAIKGKKLADWKDFVNNFPQKHDKELNAATELHYYFYSVGIGALGISSYQQLAEDKIALLHRFSNVFNLAYQRYKDITLAEAQAREAQIELGLERVRARTMAMQYSNELAEATEELHQQLSLLGIIPYRSNIAIVNQKSHLIKVWSTTNKGKVIPASSSFPIKEHPYAKKMFDAWKKKSRTIIKSSGKARVEWTKYIQQYVDFKEYQKNKVDLKKIESESAVFTIFSFKQGYFIIHTLVELIESDQNIIDRFAKVFEQTYTRFLDLQKAETQTRKAQIEVAVERVRAKALAMHTSNQMIEVVATLRDEMLGLEIPGVAAATIYLKEPKGYMRMWDLTSVEEMADGFHVALDVKFKLTQTDPNLFIRKVWNGRKKYFLVKQEAKDMAITLKWLKQYNPEYAAQAAQFFKTNTWQYVLHPTVQLANGKMSVDMLDTEPPAEMESILVKMGAAFDLAYKRFLDLQKAEEQAREAKIETALERVRARALAMQKPEELRQVAKVLRKEMGALGIEELETSSIFINDDVTPYTECWYALWDIGPSKKKLVIDYFKLDLKDTWVGRKMLKFYNSAEDKTSIVMKGNNRVEWIHYCEKQSKILRGYYGEKIPDRTYQLYKFSHGAIGAATEGDISEESWKLLSRTASVLTLAYSRFKDLSQAKSDLQKLKKAKTKAEKALDELKSTQTQLVHAEKMASLGELTAGIAHEIQNPLNFVNNFSDVNKELMEELLEELAKGDTAEVKAIAQDILNNDSKIVHHGKRAEGIVKGMLQHSRSNTGEKELTDLNQLADEYLRLSYHGLRAKDKSFNADFKLDLDKNLPKINVVPQDMGRVLLNLINNAFHAVKEVNDPKVIVRTKTNNNRIEIYVEDNGPGIPDDIKDKIFEPFFTTKPTGQGTGLGLSMSYDIITKGHGGELKVESKVGKGTEFVIKLPIV